MPAFLPAGTTLISWLREGPERTHPPFLTLFSYRWRAFWFDRNWRLQEQLCPVPAFDVDGGRPLLFVLGFWRSGTTLLHELLALGPQMAAPQTWQCMNPSAFRLASRPRHATGATRPMDAIIVDATSPQEDEFALLARGVPSVYRAWLDPRRWREVLPALHQETWLSLPEAQWFVDWRRFLGWCIPGDARTLVVKSPNHVFRLQAIHRAWPEARFVWTLRDPVDTWFSNRKMWRAMTALYGACDWRAEDLDGLLFEAFFQYAATLRWAAGALEERVVFVDFDNLASAAHEVLAVLADRLSLGSWDTWRPRVQARLERSVGHAPEEYAAAPPLPLDSGRLMKDIGDLHRSLLNSRQALRIPARAQAS